MHTSHPKRKPSCCCAELKHSHHLGKIQTIMAPWAFNGCHGLVSMPVFAKVLL